MTHRQRYLDYYAEGTRAPSITPNVWLNRIENLIRHEDARSVIDYGCGAARGICRFLPPKIKAVDYDPGLPGVIGELPLPADLVVSIHMLEHVELEKLDAVIEHIVSLALKAALIVVSCEPSTKMLPDGTPWHTVVQPPGWWLNKLGGEVQETIKPAKLEFATVIRKAPAAKSLKR